MAQYNFDIVFIDCGPTLYFDRKTLETTPLGGSEASLIRVAEELGKIAQVAVVKACDPEAGVPTVEFEPVSGQHCLFLPESYIPKMSARFCILMRGPRHIDLFPEAKKFIWCHDLGNAQMMELWLPFIKQAQATLIGVSRWHKKDLQKASGGYEKVTYIYNPVDPAIYIRDKRDRINKNIMVWAASPHKGLDSALSTFKKLKQHLPDVQLLVYNPGYVKDQVIINPGVLHYGPTTCKQVWHSLKQALCLFHPTHFRETFGLCAAEANALGCPVASYRDAGALNEVCSPNNVLAEDEDELIERIVKWYKDYPPVVFGREEFMTPNVAGDWLKILAKG